jgi:hypothetical protein
VVLRKTTIVSRVRSPFAARSKVGDKFLKLGHTAFYLNANKDLSRRRLNQDIYPIRYGAVISVVRLQQNVAFEPTAFQDQQRSCRELTNAFAKKAGGRRIVAKDLTHLVRGVSYA